MFDSPPTGPVHTSGTLADRPRRAATEHADRVPAVAIATKARTVPSARAMADGQRAIFPDLRELMKLAGGAFCDLQVVLERAVGGEVDFEVSLGPVAKRGRAVVSARTPAIEREHDWTGISG